MGDLSSRIASLSPEQRTLLERRLKASARPAPARAAAEPIAIVGMGCRFPGAVASPDAFWRLLTDGIDAISEVPADRWDVDSVYDPDPEARGKMSTRWGGFVERVAEFDAAFFGISPREAARMDPQQRLLLEVAWEALEDAGQPTEQLSGRAAGVFLGIHSLSSDYYLRQSSSLRDVDVYTSTGVAHSIVANRLSYVLDLSGPSLVVDTACSSSLVAVHLACQSLRLGECELAVAGGVNLILSPEVTVALSKLNMMAPDGRCKTFDARADGFVRSEGCGIVILRRLADALADGDPVVAVIRGTAVNQDGATNGITAPSGLAQQAVVRRALENGGVEARSVSYVETHGTGTALGDPIEVEALTETLGRGEGPCFLGAVKSNIGHLEAAAGIAGLIKAALCLRYRFVPPNLHFHTPNPHLELGGSRFVIPTEGRPWTITNGFARVAGVSSFGFGGTNAHVVLEEAPAAPAVAAAATARPLPLCFSARSVDALRARAADYAAFLADPQRGAGVDLLDVAYSAAVRRSHHPERAAVVGASREEWIAALQRFGARPEPLSSANHQPGLVFVYSGQGSQWAGMGLELYRTESVFRASLERADAEVRRLAGWSLLEALSAGDAELRLRRTDVAQPALFALQAALTELLRAWGVEAEAVLGHSAGEVAAAHAAGVLSFEEALGVAVERGRLMQAAAGQGEMAAVELAVEEVERMLASQGSRLEVASVNSPTSTVICGENGPLETLVGSLEARGVCCKRLNLGFAFHSRQMEPFRDQLARTLRSLRPARPRLPVFSTFSGRRVEEDDYGATYWANSIRERVRFAEAVAACAREGRGVFLEIGPHPVLRPMIRRCGAALDHGLVPIASLRRGEDEPKAMLEALCSLYALGYPVDWSRYLPRGGRAVCLPTYPWQRKRFWIEPRTTPLLRQGEQSLTHPLLGVGVSTALKQTIYEQAFSVEGLPFLADHRVQGKVVVPAAAYAEMGLAAAAVGKIGVAPAVHDLLIHEPMVFEPGASLAVQSIVSPEDHGRARLQVFARPEGGEEWRLHAEAWLQHNDGPAPAVQSPAELAARCGVALPVEGHYEALRLRGLDFGPAFAGVEVLLRGDGEALGRVGLPDIAAQDARAYQIHPALLDACLQVVGALLPDGEGATDTYLPFSLGRLTLHRQVPERVWSHVRRRAGVAGENAVSFDVRMLDQDGAIVAELEGLCLKRVAAGALVRRAVEDDWFYELAWEPRPLSAEAALPVPGTAPSPALIAHQVRPLLQPLGEQHLASYRELLPHIEELSTDYILLALHLLGWDWREGEPVAIDVLARRLGVADGYHRLFGRFLDILAEDGILRRTGSIEVARVPNVPAEKDLSRRAAALLERLPSTRALITLLTRCGERLTETLRGESDPLELLFPGGSLALAEGLNEETPFARFHNAIVREVVSRVVQDLPADRPIRVLEIGAGTGSTTSYVLPFVPADRTEYFFTDLSPMFTARAQEKFRAYPFVRYRLLNIENDPVRQGLEPHAFDVVLAANVLHATRDLGEALRNVARLLTPEGTLVLLEGTEPQRWLDLTFGLTEGWWRFADAERRPHYPLLSADGWRRLLVDTGFAASAFIPEAGSREARFCQQTVILARSPSLEVAGEERGRWLVFADAGGVGHALASRLEARGDSVRLVFPGPTAVHADGSWTVDPATPGDFGRLLSEPGNAGPWLGVLHLWSLDNQPPGATTLAALEADVARACGSVLHLVQALATASRAKTRGLWLVTRGAEAVGGAAPVSVAQSPLAGLSKVIALEHPELRCVHLDLDPAPDADPVGGLLRELMSPDGEEQVALRAGRRLAARVVRKAPEAAAPGDAAPVRLEIAQRGVLDNLALRPVQRRVPGPAEVELRVEASGLNFRDVLSALDMNPGDDGPLGVECAGRVVAVGGSVEGLRVGDEVLAVAVGSLATYVTTHASLAVRKPTQMSAEEGATIPSAFLTAWYSLHHLGAVSPGHKVLIHAAAGGVGLAAVQLARRAGAEVFATAGNPEKREFLRSLGVTHVMDSRSLEFAREVKEKTRGRGVDLVLNSLTGEFIPAGLSVLAPGGRFIELGHREVWDQEQVAQVRRGVVYEAFNLLEIAQADPALIASLLRAVMKAFADGSLTPLCHRDFPLEHAVAAFRYMAQARHIGKIVLTQRSAASTRVDATQFREDATYLVTGGLAGLGLRVARWMADRGARNLVLVGRSEPDAAAREAVAALQRDGVDVEMARADVSRQDEVAAVLDGIRRQRPPLRGVMHAAGTLDDGTIVQQDWSRFARVMAAKVSGSWILHALTEECPLDFFVFFSSAVSLFGRSGQSSHAAANAFEDALAHHRRRHGLPAVSVNWGAWGGTGSVTRGNVAERISRQGILAMAPEAGLRALERVMAETSPQVGVLAADWTRFFAAIPSGREPRLLAQLAHEARSLRSGAPAAAVEEAPFLRRFAQAPPANRPNLLVGLALEHSARVLGLDPSCAIDPQQPLHELGLDSLMAVELRNALGTALSRNLQATLLFDYPTLAALAGYLERLLAPEGLRERDASPNETRARARAVKELQRLSDDEAEAQLLEELQAAHKRA